MKISELISELEKLKDEHGDLLVECHNEAGDYEFVETVEIRSDISGVNRVYIDM